MTKKKVSKKTTKKPLDEAIAKIEEKKEEEKEVKTSSRTAKSNFYFQGKQFKTGDQVDLGKEELSFLDEKGKLK